MGKNVSWMVAGIVATFGMASWVIAASKEVPDTITALPATYHFSPGARTEIAVAAADDVMVAWKADYDSSQTCRRSCIEAKDRYGDGSVSTHYGGIRARSRDGRISVIMTNVEQFDMEVSIQLE
ncbi:MAG: hypothetical protein PVJ73_09275 [Acidobacteriota bacterium]|jgi:hypothetical protein